MWKAPIGCEVIPFIDDSGSSSCSSSLQGDEPFFGMGDEDDDDDAASLNRLLDDAASRELSLSDLQDELITDGEGGCRKSKGRYLPYSSSHSSPISRKSYSSIKSSDDVIDFDLLVASNKPPPSLPPPLPPCANSEASSCCSTSDYASSELCCTKCALGCHPPTRTEVSGSNHPSGDVTPTKLSSRSSPEGDSKVPRITAGESSPNWSRSSSGKIPEEPNPETYLFVKGSVRPLKSGTKDLVFEYRDGVPSNKANNDWHSNVKETNGYVANENSFSLVQNCTTNSSPSSIANSSPPSVANSSPPSKSSSEAIAGTVPHHYISTMKMAAAKGSTDMGGALVSRVATFLRSQYKSLNGSPAILSWCQRFKLFVSEFETTLVEMPLAPHLKVPAGLSDITSILEPHVQVSFNESVVEDRPRRVLIEGEAGYSNSNICFKMGRLLSKFIFVWIQVGASLVFVLTLRDFRGGSLFSYMCKEILPRHILSREAMNTLWSHLKKIEEKVLFLLVGYDEANEDEVGDLTELIDGQSFPSASVVITCQSGCRRVLPKVLHRKFLITGLNHTQTTNFILKYFDSLGKPDCGSEVMALVTSSQEKYGELPRCPVMCLAVGVLYEDLGGKLPSRLSDFFMSFLKHTVRKNLLRRGEPMCYGVLPDKYIRMLQDFGKLALENLKASNPYFAGSDLKTKVQHGGEIVSLGILLRMRSMSKLNRKEYYAPAHVSLLEFLAAFYISSLIHSYALLQSELDSLLESLNFTNFASGCSCGIMILRYLVGVLGRNAYMVFNIVSQMGTSHRLLFLLLRESGMSQMNVLEVCKHVAGREHVVIQTNSTELEDWGRLLYSPDCSLEGVEVLLDFDGSSKDRHESFFSCLSFNESVKSIKLTCVIGGDFGKSEVTRLVSHVRTVLTKRRLESFELTATSLEDSTAEVLSPVVDMICDTLPELAPSLTKLILALELEGEQVVRLCEILKLTPHVKVLHLPHLACGYVGLEAVAQLVQCNPLVSLNLTGSLSTGTPIDDKALTAIGAPSPSKEETSPLSFWNFVDAQGTVRSVFNSLPRSFYQSIPRRDRCSSLLNDKRNSDSTLLQKTCFPPPSCSICVHQNGFHQIFTVFRNSSCHVCNLNVSKCTLGAEDLVCLGETIRFTKCLTSLRMEGLSRMAELIPILVALQENKTLQLLDLTSPHILLGDAAFQVTLNSLGKNTSLRFLVLNGWTLQLESERSLQDFLNFLTLTEMQHLEMSGCRVVVTVHDGPLGRLSRQDDVFSALQEGVKPLTNNTVAFLNLDNFEVHINGKVILRGPQLLFLLRHLPKLVDVSLASNPGSDAIVDSATLRIFSLLPTAFPCLKRIRITGWVFSLDNCEKVLRACGKYLRRSQLREVHLKGVQVRETSGKADLEHHLLVALLSNLHHLSILSLCGLVLSQPQVSLLGKALREKLLSSKLDVETKGLSYNCLKALRQAITEGGKCEFLFEGGPLSVYHLKKVDRKDKLLSKWVCAYTSEKYGDV